MKNLQEATERICELKGSLVALDTLLPAVIDTLSAPALARLMASFDLHAEVARTVLLNTDISDVVLATFEREVARNRALLQRSQQPARGGPAASAALGFDLLLLSTTGITTLVASHPLSRASGFFFRRGARLFLVSSGHVFADAQHSHRPDRIEFRVHTDPQDPTRHAPVSLPLYRQGLALWRAATDSGSPDDVAVLEIPADSLPADAVLQAFDETHLGARDERIGVGEALTIVGHPPACHDSLHHLAVAHRACLASAYGVRFRGQGCFMTDARASCTSSGSPVLVQRSQDRAAAASPSWQLLGVHSTRAELARDGSSPPGLHCAWYADPLLNLTD